MNRVPFEGDGDPTLRFMLNETDAWSGTAKGMEVALMRPLVHQTMLTGLVPRFIMDNDGGGKALCKIEFLIQCLKNAGLLVVLLFCAAQLPRDYPFLMADFSPTFVKKNDVVTAGKVPRTKPRNITGQGVMVGLNKTSKIASENMMVDCASHFVRASVHNPIKKFQGKITMPKQNSNFKKYTSLSKPKCTVVLPILESFASGGVRNSATEIHNTHLASHSGQHAKALQLQVEYLRTHTTPDAQLAADQALALDGMPTLNITEDEAADLLEFLQDYSQRGDCPQLRDEHARLHFGLQNKQEGFTSSRVHGGSLEGTIKPGHCSLAWVFCSRIMKKLSEEQKRNPGFDVGVAAWNYYKQFSKHLQHEGMYI